MNELNTSTVVKLGCTPTRGSFVVRSAMKVESSSHSSERFMFFDPSKGNKKFYTHLPSILFLSQCQVFQNLFLSHFRVFQNLFITHFQVFQKLFLFLFPSVPEAIYIPMSSVPDAVASMIGSICFCFKNRSHFSLLRDAAGNGETLWDHPRPMEGH